jgi:hypothetical protein
MNLALNGTRTNCPPSYQVGIVLTQNGVPSPNPRKLQTPNVGQLNGFSRCNRREFVLLGVLSFSVQ